MKILMKDLEDAVGFYSSKASDYCHQLGIAGIVMIWALFTYNFKTDPTCRIVLIIAFIFFICTITFSLIHYFALALLADKNFHKSEKTVNPDNSKTIKEIREIPVEENLKFEKKSWLYFKVKMYGLIIAYALTIIFVGINFLKF